MAFDSYLSVKIKPVMLKGRRDSVVVHDEVFEIFFCLFGLQPLLLLLFLLFLNLVRIECLLFLSQL
jgi:hypothetical protein